MCNVKKMKRRLAILGACLMAPALAMAVATTFTSVSLPYSLEARFTETPIVVDGSADEAWSPIPSRTLDHPYNVDLNGAPQEPCAIQAKIRAAWDGALLYMLVSVTDPSIDTRAEQIANRDGVEFWVDHFNDKAANFQEDDGTFTVTAPPTAFIANRAQNALFENVTSRYLAGYASSLRHDAAGQVTGYDVEIAWHLGEHARAQGSSFGFDIGVNDAQEGQRVCRLFWNAMQQPRTTNDTREWGTIVLQARGHGAAQPDRFMLGQNLAKAKAVTRGIWRDEKALDAAITVAEAARSSADQRRIDRANLKLDNALRGLRRTGPYPDPQDLPARPTLPDPFTFFDGKRVKTRADWERRRAEIKALMQYYEFGIMPPKPELLTATDTINGNSRNLVIQMTDQGRSASFAPRLTLPSPEQAAASGRHAPFAVIVSLDFALNDGNPNYLAAGYAVLSIPARDVHSDNVAHTGPIFDLYPYDVAAGHDFGSLLGWAWSASRAVDALEYLLAHDPAWSTTVEGKPAPLIALDKLAVTGFSRMGKAALLTGMLDERFAVTHAGASGSGGAAPYRFVPFGNQYAWGFTSGSETLGDHLRHQTHNSNEMMRRFLNDTTPAAVQPRMYLTRTHGYGERLPFDHHLEIAAIAPRAVLIANTNDDYGNNAEGDAIGVQGARPVFEWLGAGDRLGLDLNMGGGGHSLKPAQQQNFVRFLDHVLFGVPLPADASFRRDPYLTGSPDGGNIYDIYYGGLGKMMPWRDPPPAPRP
jgi:glucuronyl esterase-like protein/cellulose/xylan binding protein with CBM9 domain